jgi:hypothetical protein
MVGKLKRNLLLTMLVILLFISVCTQSILPAQGAEESVQQETARIAKNVIAIDTAKYSANSEYKQDSYLGVLPQENIRYTLEAKESKLDLYYTFVNGKLEKIHVLEVQGTPEMQKNPSTDPINKAQDFLKSYQNYSKNSFYGDLESMIANIDTPKNTTITTGNIKLSVTAQASAVTFRWIYTTNNIEAPDKCVALHYENGFLSYFIDNWDIYKIGSTTVNVSEKQATDIAIAEAKTFTWSTTLDNKTYEGLKYNVTNAMVWETVFGNSVYMENKRDQDPLTLYPMRHIWVSFDKFYPCNVYGMNVYVWADTGKIGHIQEGFTTMDPPSNLTATVDDITALTISALPTDSVISDFVLAPSIVVLAFATLTVGLVILCLWKKMSLHNLDLTNRHPKIRGALLCFLIASTTLLALAVAQVSAYPFNGRATIWGSESSDSWDPNILPNGSSWRKHYDEVTQQQTTSAFIASKFNLNGYYGSDYQGIKGSDKNSILNQIQSNQINYAKVAVVDFDHGNGVKGIPGLPSNEFHFMFEDQRGTMSGTVAHQWPIDHPEYAVYDYEIYERTSVGKYYFVLINACNSAYIDDTLGGDDCTQGMVNGRARGMPYAWSHGIRVLESGTTTPPSGWMSGDGFACPDNNGFCFMGFKMGSASLTQPIQGTVPYWSWLERFFEKALTNDWSVKQALNEASQHFFNCDFDETTFGGDQGFIASWPMFISGQWQEIYSPEQRRGWLEVYGDSNVKLYQPQVTLAANAGLSPSFTIDGQSAISGARVFSGGHYFYAQAELPNYSFHHFICNGQEYDWNNAYIPITSSSTVTAYYNWHPSTCHLTVAAYNEGGTTGGSGDYTYNSIQYAYAYPDQNHVLIDWIITTHGETFSLGSIENPKDVCMSSDVSLYAVFAPIQTTHSLSVDAFCWSMWCPVTSYVEIDGGSSGTGYTPVTFYGLSNTDHTITVYTPEGPYDYYFSHMYYEGGAVGNPATITLNGDYHVTAYYYIPFLLQGEEPPDEQ